MHVALRALPDAFAVVACQVSVGDSVMICPRLLGTFVLDLMLNLFGKQLLQVVDSFLEASGGSKQCCEGNIKDTALFNTRHRNASYKFGQ